MRSIKYLPLLMICWVACDTGNTSSITGWAAMKERLTRLDDLHELRAAHSATLLTNGKVLIVAGFRKGPDTYSQLYSRTAELYDPVTRKFSYTGSLQIPRCGQTATLLPGGDVLITGGNNDTPRLASAELYNSSSGTWTRLPDMLSGREGHHAILLVNGKVLIMGGSQHPDLYAELYNPTTHSFEKAGPSPLNLSGSCVVQLRDGRVFIIGGWMQRQPVQYSMIYDPATNRFTRTADLNIVNYKAGAALLPDGKVIVIGGSNNRDWMGKYNTTEIYDPQKNVFRKGPRLQFQRFKLNHAIVTLSNGAIVVAGGDSHIETLNPGDSVFRTSAVMDQPYYFSTATLLPTGIILLAGGYGNSAQCVSKAWLYNPRAR
ncbi:MAG TPA: kelch repeat-containing protein [Puia sp.]